MPKDTTCCTNSDETQNLGPLDSRSLDLPTELTGPRLFALFWLACPGRVSHSQRVGSATVGSGLQGRINWRMCLQFSFVFPRGWVHTDSIGTCPILTSLPGGGRTPTYSLGYRGFRALAEQAFDIYERIEGLIICYNLKTLSNLK